MDITGRKVLKYTALPGVKLRLKALFYTGFQYIPFFIALVYQSVKLLPAGHPYGNAANMGQFGVRHVIAEAANNLVIKRENIDQILLFILVLVGMAIAVFQIVALVFGLFMQPVFAQTEPFPTTFTGFFVTQFPHHDLAFMMLDMVFGVPDLFGSCIADAAIECFDLNDRAALRVSPGDWVSPEGWILSNLGWPYPIHYAMRQMFQFYSFGLLIVATMIALYFVVTVVIETAQTGTPFGKRFNKIWAPIRIVVAFGLLIPVGHGLNSSQYLVLYAAKYGSGLATNGWTRFNLNLTGEGVNYLTGLSPTVTTANPNHTLVSTPNVPDISGLLQFMFVAYVCKVTEETEYQRDIDLYLVKDPLATPPFLRIGVENEGLPDQNTLGGTTYQDAINFIDGASQIILRIGEHNPQDYRSEMGHVHPFCGEIVIPLSDPRNPESTTNPPEPGAAYMQAEYWDLLKFMWFDTVNQNRWAEAIYEENGAQGVGIANTGGPYMEMPDINAIEQINEYYKTTVENSIYGAVITQINGGEWAIADSLMRRRGWGGAAIWYNKIAEMNGAMTLAVMNVPVVGKYPKVMEHVYAEKKQREGNTTPGTRFKPTVAGGQDIQFLRPKDKAQADVYWEAYQLWKHAGMASTPHASSSGNAFNDMVMSLFGTSGLYSMRRNEGTHPLAMLTGVGRSLVESAIKNIGFALASTTGGLGASFLDIAILNKGGEVAIGLFMTFAMIGITVGFVLFYVVPFLPFIYFFFALGGWVKGIFEAMVGAPLWALAHIRIDGNGLPGSAAMNGYLMIFEIFLRPILIVFGMLASITTFSALVGVLNQTWEMVTANLVGFDAEYEASLPAGSTESMADLLRGPLDEFFFTVVYTIIVYLMAMASFKLIDLIPNNILRWMGQSVQTFNDMNEDAAQGLTGKMAAGSQQVTSTVGGGAESLLKQASKGKNIGG